MSKPSQENFLTLVVRLKECNSGFVVRSYVEDNASVEATEKFRSTIALSEDHESKVRVHIANLFGEFLKYIDEIKGED